MAEDPSRPDGSHFPDAYREQARFERNRFYHFASPIGDPWFDTRMLAVSGPRQYDFPFELEGLVEDAGPIQLELALWGVTDFPNAPDHHLVVEVNGMVLADEWFDGLVDHPIAVEVPGGLVQATGNTLRLRQPHDTGAQADLVHFDGFEVGYPRHFQAGNGALRFAAAGRALRVGGLESADVEVYRLSAAGTERLAGVLVSGFPGAYEAVFPGRAQEATYLVATAAGRVPAIAEPAPRRQTITGFEAELLIIAHPDFVAGVEPLAQARRNEGLSVAVVDVEQVYEQFGHGLVDPEPIRLYVAHARAEMGTRYALLVGGDTYGYHDYLGLGSVSFIPTPYAATDPIVRFAPVDPLYADVDLDLLPDLAIGRLPVRTPAELDEAVAKTLEFASAGHAGRAVLTADAFDVPSGFSFTAASEEMRALLPAGWQIEPAYMDDLGLAGARDKLFQEVADGVALTSYFGHSGLTAWSFQGLFRASDVAQLDNPGRPTLVTQWGCWNTYHVAPTYDTLGHRLMLEPDRGAAAVLGAATLTEAPVERRLGRQLFARLGVPGVRLGDALREAKEAVAAGDPDQLDVILGYTLLGDPTLIVQP